MPTDATRDLSCPNGCVDMEATAHDELGNANDLLETTTKDDAICPGCGAPLGGGD